MASAGQRLLGKCALVTGGASGFGEGIVRRFIDEGARVAIADLNLEGARSLAARCGTGALAFQVDVSEESSVREMAAKVLEAFPGLDVLVNNAGVGLKPTPLDEVDLAAFERVFATNARSVFLTARSFVPVMKRRKSGVILNVAST